MTTLIPIAIAEKNPLLVSEMTSYLEHHGPFRVVLGATNATPVMEAAPSGQFDIAVIGWEVTDGGAIHVLERLRQQSGVRVVVYTGCTRPEVPYQALSHGAAGFCAKMERPEKLMETLLAVAAGRMAFPYLDISRLDDDPLGELTAKEKGLLAAIAKGQTNREIGENFDISLNTVKFHVKNIYQKLDIYNRAQAASYYIERTGRH